MSFLNLEGKKFLITGVANKKSVAYCVATALEAEGAKLVYLVQNQAIAESKLLTGKYCELLDVEQEGAAEKLASRIGPELGPFDGLLHSIAFADYSEGFKDFHHTSRRAYLQAMEISAFSLVELSSAFKLWFSPKASVVSMSISSVTLTAEDYGYMAPVKAALEANSRFLAKSFSKDSELRFNTINAGPLKTSASAGIPNYMENYLYAEKMTYRKRALQTQEVADAALFLLSPRSSGINGTGVVVDAGLGQNYFDRELVQLAMRPQKGE